MNAGSWQAWVLITQCLNIEHNNKYYKWEALISVLGGKRKKKHVGGKKEKKKKGRSVIKS